MIEQILIPIFTTVVGVAFGTYIGAKIMKKELMKQISGYIMNEVPHLLESEEFKDKARELAHVFIREVIEIVCEELGLTKKRRRT